MSKYTTELRFICESMSGFGESRGYADVDTIIGEARSKIFGFNYPIFDETYREALERKILEAYYTREIAFESVGLWRLKLQTKMRQIMPYYNQLYKSTLLEFNPLYDVDVTVDRSGSSNGSKTTDGTVIQGTIRKVNGTITTEDNVDNTGTVTNAGTVKDTGTVTDNSTVTNNLTDTTVVDGTNVKTKTGSDTDAYNDTPQGAIGDLAMIEANGYLTNYRKKTNELEDSEDIDRTDTTTRSGTVGNEGTVTNDLTSAIDNTTTNNLNTKRNGATVTNNTTDIDDTIDEHKTDAITNTETYLEKVAGKRGSGSYSELLLKYRETFLNIDMQVIDELGDLFFTLW